MATPRTTAPKWVPSGCFRSILGGEGDPLRRVFFCPDYRSCWWLRWFDQARIVSRYAASFARVVIVPCIMRPENWEHCRRVDRWLLPAVQDLVDFYTVEAYSKEQELLRAEDH